MAEPSTVARPYAEAVFKLALETQSLEAWSSLLQDLALIVADPATTAVISDPNARDDQIFDLLQSALGRELSSEASNFLRTLMDNGRLLQVPEIARQFQVLKNAHEGSAEAHISSAFPLSDTQLAELVTALERHFKVQIKPEVVIDPSLIGGVRVEVGDQVLDGSVRAQLSAMRTQLGAP